MLAIRNISSYNNTTFAYDGLSDRLARRTDARGLSTTYAYDQHGRLTSEASPDGTFTYTYMSAGPALGQLQRVEGNGATWAYAYDQRGLLVQEQMSMDGQTLRAVYQHDALGRTSTRTYPSGYAVRYAYSSIDGELTHIESTDGQPLWRRGQEDALGRPLSEQIGGLERTYAYDAMGHLTALSQGSISRRYAYDAATGSITRREANGPLLGSTVEQFAYDAQDRLISINGAQVAYDQRGNITQMPGVGAMQHAGYRLNGLTAQQGFSRPEVDVEYGANGRARELRIVQTASQRSIRYKSDIIPPPINEPEPIPIDPRLPIVEPKPNPIDPRLPILEPEPIPIDPRLPVLEPEPTPIDPRLPILEPKPNPKDPRLPIIEPVPPIDDPRPVPSPKDPRDEPFSFGTAITVITTTTDTWKWLALHGPGGIKIRTKEFKSTTVSEQEEGSHISTTVGQTSSDITTRYYAPSFEREITNGQTTDYTYIESPNGLIAAVKRAGNKQDVMLLATDHLGSIVGVWNAQGTLLEEHRYTAWGQRTSSTASPRLRRGFTGHEHLAQFGLIDMQARLYDPHLGRFLAPDPYVQAPSMSMNFNRYAYCMNNPLKYTDPTGEFCIGAAIFIGGFINFAIQGITGNINSFGDCVKAWTIGGLSGLTGAAAGAAVAGALGAATSVGSAIGYGALAGAAGGAAGGFVGGAGAAWLNGASFKDGLTSGLVGAGLGAASGAIIGGVSGGLSFRKQAAVFRKGCSDLNVDPAEAVPATDQFLSDAQKAWFPDAPMDKVREFTVENVPEGYFQVAGREDAAGATIALSSKEKLTGFSKVYFNKELAFTSAKRLFYTMGHELVHVSQYAALAGESVFSTTRALGFSEMIEIQAHNYQVYLGDNLSAKITTNYTKYFQETLWTNFKWTYNHSFKYPF